MRGGTNEGPRDWLGQLREMYSYSAPVIRECRLAQAWLPPPAGRLHTFHDSAHVGFRLSCDPQRKHLRLLTFAIARHRACRSGQCTLARRNTTEYSRNDERGAKTLFYFL